MKNKNKIFLFAAMILLIACRCSFALEIDPGTPLNAYTSLAEWNKGKDIKSWKFKDIDNAEIADGVLKGVCVKNCDALFWCSNNNGLPSVDLDSLNNKFIEFRFKRTPSKSELEFFYGTIDEPPFSPLRMISLKSSSLPQDGKFHVYRID